jgi:hypothetical protein
LYYKPFLALSVEKNIQCETISLSKLKVCPCGMTNDNYEDKNNNNQLSPWNRALLENPKVLQQLQEFARISGARKFNTVFTRAGHRYLSQMNPNYTLLMPLFLDLFITGRPPSSKFPKVSFFLISHQHPPLSSSMCGI